MLMVNSPMRGSDTTNYRREILIKRARNAAISIIAAVIIVWFLLSKIDPRDIPHAIGNVSLQGLLLAFLLYAASVFFKAVRFKVILRTGITLRQLFPIVSLYMFFANILPMRTGELSYVYLLKRQARTPGTKSFASLVVGGISDAAVILLAMSIVGWYLRSALTEGISRFFSAAGQVVKGNLLPLAAVTALLLVVIIGLLMLRRHWMQGDRISRIRHLASSVKVKVLEVGSELANVSFDMRLLGIIACSVLIISLRFSTLWYLVRSMGIAINIWKLSFALLFGVLFSLVPVHGPAGFGTVEAPWVMSLVLLNVPEKDAITSGFGLHIVIIMYCIVLGLCGAIALKVSSRGAMRDG